MKVSTCTEVACARFGAEKGIELLAQSGYDCLDYSMFSLFSDPAHPVNGAQYESYLLRLKRLGADCGVSFNQAHAPFPSEPDGVKYNTVVRAIEAAALLGAGQIIVHPITVVGDSEETLRVNLAFYGSLQRYAKEFGIKIALENMFWGDTKGGLVRLRPGACGTGEWFRRMYDALDGTHFTCCVDIGHAGLVGETADQMLTALGHDRVGALHVHDNDYLSDQHLMPFFGKLDWKKITAALREIRYAGDLTLEADATLLTLPDECLPAACRLMCQSARALASMI